MIIIIVYKYLKRIAKKYHFTQSRFSIEILYLFVILPYVFIITSDIVSILAKTKKKKIYIYIFFQIIL